MTTALNNPITAKHAVKMALEYVREMYADSGSQIMDLSLEEIQPTDDGDWWHVTVGFFRLSDPNISPSAYLVAPSSEKKRQYKIVPVNRQTGDIRGLCIREL